MCSETGNVVQLAVVWDGTCNVCEGCLCVSVRSVLPGLASCAASLLLCLVTSFAVIVISLSAKCQKPQSLVLILVCSGSTHAPGELA